jgi:hypothetical protein
MKKIKAICLAAMTALAMTLSPQPVQAQDEVDEFGIFDHVAAGVVIGTTGAGIDVSAPIGNYVQVRAGYNFFPTFKYKEDVDYRAKGKKERGKTEAEGKSHFSTGHLLFDFYPFRNSSFHATAGFYYGTDEVATLENLIPVKDFEPGEGIVIGDYIVGFDQNGYAHGAIKVNKFRPYVGIGIGRSVPRKRFGVSGDLGVQFWGKPKVYEKQTGMDLEVKKEDLGDDSNKYYDVISKFSVWPVVTLRLTYRIF